MWELIFVLTVLFIGSFIQGSTGFGFGLFSMGLLPILLTLKNSTLLVLALTVIISLNIVIRFRNYIHIKDLLFILSSALAGRVMAFFFLNVYGDMDIMKKFLGPILILVVIYLNVRKNNTYVLSFDKPIFAVIIGLIGGIMGGVFAIGGPFFVFYFLMRYADKNSYNANLQVSFVIMNIFTIVLHGVNGDINHEIILHLVLGAFATLIGVNLGLKWFERLPHGFIKKLASLIVLIASLNLIIFS